MEKSLTIVDKVSHHLLAVQPLFKTQEQVSRKAKVVTVRNLHGSNAGSLFEDIGMTRSR